MVFPGLELYLYLYIYFLLDLVPLHAHVKRCSGLLYAVFSMKSSMPGTDLDMLCQACFQFKIFSFSDFFIESAHWVDSVIESRCPSVCLFVTSPYTLFQRLWRPMVKERNPHISI